MQARMPPGWDFMKIASGGATFQRGDLVFQALFNSPNTPQTGCTGEQEPVLAQGFNWLSDTKVEIKLREGVKFHNKPPVNGRPFTANDVVYSVNRLIQHQARVAAAAHYVAQVQAKDAATVVISLKEPFADLLGFSFLGASLYGALMLAREAGGPDESWENPAKSYIGTGPFMFHEYVDGVSITYTRNPDYWKPGLPYVDAVKFLIVPDSATEEAMLRSGKVDLWYMEPSFRIVESLRKTSPQLGVYPCPSFAPGHIYWRVDKPPLDDVRVRRALSMAIDREGLLQALLGGDGEVVFLASPSSHPLYLGLDDLPPEIRRYYEYHPDEAKQLLAEAGYPGGRGLSITLGESPRRELLKRQVAEAVVASWQRLGVNASLNLMEYGQYTQTVLAGEYEGAGHTSFLAPAFFNNMAQLLSTNPFAQNRSHVSDPELDRLTRQLLGTIDPAKQRDLARRVQLRRAEMVYSFGHLHENLYSLWQPWVKNYGPVPTIVGNTASWAEIAWLEK